MTTGTPLTPYELNERAVDVLLRELGPADTARFVRQVRDGSGDYTADRVAWFAGLSLDDLLAEAETARRSSTPALGASQEPLLRPNTLPSDTGH